MDIHSEKILILDFGSQYTQLIARRLRELGVYCEIHPCTMKAEAMRAFAPRGVVLSGGPASVTAADSPRPDPLVFQLGVPVLGICYGLQLMAHTLGGRVGKSHHREFGPATVQVKHESALFAGLPDRIDVWMSHGDGVEAIPPGFEPIAATPSAPFAAVEDRARRFFAVQFHPEVVHTPQGKDLLWNFAHVVCGCSGTWSMRAYVDVAVEQIRRQVGTATSSAPSPAASTRRWRRCWSTGPSATSCAASSWTTGCSAPASGPRWRRSSAGCSTCRSPPWTPPGASSTSWPASPTRSRSARSSAGSSSPSSRRRWRSWPPTASARQFLVQGTLYPDVIESVSFKGPSATIKSHHNVGGLPDVMKLALVEPLRELFKDEVRRLGLELGLPPQIVGRQPFPGPGLAIRVLGEVTEERLAVLRRADVIVQEEIRKAGLYDQLWQAFAVLLPVRSVGVMGDERTYESTCAIRAIESTDGMTGDWARLPYDLLGRMSSRIINEVRGINRCVYDISSKPPATIEWE